METVSGLAGYQLPVPIVVTTRRPIRLDLFSSDRDRLLKFPACSALLVRALASDHRRPLGRRTCVGGIFPSDPGSNIGGIERPMGRFTGSAAGSLIQRGTNFPPDGCAEDRADRRRSGLAATLAKLAAEDCAGCSTHEGTRGFVLAHPAATSEKHCQGEDRAHVDGVTANRVCCLEHDVFPLVDDLVRAGPVSRSAASVTPILRSCRNADRVSNEASRGRLPLRVHSNARARAWPSPRPCPGTNDLRGG